MFATPPFIATKATVVASLQRLKVNTLPARWTRNRECWCSIPQHTPYLLVTVLQQMHPQIYFHDQPVRDCNTRLLAYVTDVGAAFFGGYYRSAEQSLPAGGSHESPDFLVCRRPFVATVLTVTSEAEAPKEICTHTPVVRREKS